MAANPPGQFGRIANPQWSKTSEAFPDPFADMTSLYFPDSIDDALWWSERIVLTNGIYREALSRVVSYFVTDVEICDTDEEMVGHEEKQEYLEFFNGTLGIRPLMVSVAMDYLIYGISLTSLYIPFQRYLSCKGKKNGRPCGHEAPLKKVAETPNYKYAWKDFEFHATCPACGYKGVWSHDDRRAGNREDIRVRRWNPHHIDIIHDEISGDSAYIWKIPSTYREHIRRGDLFQLSRAPWEVVEAVKNDDNLLFDPDVIYAMKEDPPAGVELRGWGLSRVLTNFRQAWYYQILHRFNEAIALDYVIPFRVLTPQAKQGQAAETTDPVLGMDLGGFVQQVYNMLSKRRRDPASWHVLPFPLEYNPIGGDASQLAPKDLLDLAVTTLLNSAGVPRELFDASLSVQAAPAALRLFEANWSHLVHRLNKFLEHITTRVSQRLSWNPVRVRMQRVRHADDLNRQMAMLQLGMGREISKTTSLGSIGVDAIEEERRKIEEEQLTALLQQQAQEKMEGAAEMQQMATQPAPPGQQQTLPMFQGMPGAMPGGGVPPTGGPQGGAVPPDAQTATVPGSGVGPMGAPAGPFGAVQQMMSQIGTMPTDTPQALMSKANTVADMLETLPDAQRHSALVQLKDTDPTLHPLVTSILDDRRRQRELEGRAMIEQQQQQPAMA